MGLGRDYLPWPAQLGICDQKILWSLLVTELVRPAMYSPKPPLACQVYYTALFLFTIQIGRKKTVNLVEIDKNTKDKFNKSKKAGEIHQRESIIATNHFILVP